MTLSRRAAAVLAFLRGGAAGGVVLALATLAALVVANTPYGEVARGWLAVPLGIMAGDAAFVRPLGTWVNDALMALFFLLVGLEIRRELVEGQLASVRRAAAPGLAALGGMAMPAAIYAAFAWRNPAALRGWAIPVATDIVFSLLVLRMLGRRVPAGVRVFVTALAIIDDLAAIAVIALCYTAALDVPALVAAAGVWLGLLVLNGVGVRALAPFMLGFVALWACLARAGVHPTLAGVAVAFVVPLRERDGTSPARLLEQGLGPWVACCVLPLFAFANAGLRFGSLSLAALTDPVVPGIVLGLCIGKPLGVFGTTWLAVRLRLVRLPAQLTWRLLGGGAVLCGIGFTMSLFIGTLAFPDGARAAEVKAAVFFASLLSATAAVVVLRWMTRGPGYSVSPSLRNGE